MTTRRVFIGSSLALAGLPLLSHAQTCCAAGATAAGKKTETAPKLKVTGAILIEANAQKTIFKIKCAKCGYQTAAIEIDTPTADKPYRQEWKCPKCGYKQTVAIEIATA